LAVSYIYLTQPHLSYFTSLLGCVFLVSNEVDTKAHSVSDQIHSADGLRILCFDGGGVRGKASLLLLKNVMDRIGPGAKPCDFFDLIAGTSTGSLIAIMLARLGYSVDEAIKIYDELYPRIFTDDAAIGRNWILYDNPLVPEDPVEQAFRDICRRVNGEDELMNNGSHNRCKVSLYPQFVSSLYVAHAQKFVVLRDHCVARSPRNARSHPLVSFC
jgi:hypothetical protein